MKLDIQLFASGTITKTSGPSVGDIRILWESSVNNNQITITTTLQMRKTSGYMFGTFNGSIVVNGVSQNISMYRPESAPWNTTWKDVGTTTTVISNITGTNYEISGSVKNTGTAMAGTYTASGTAVINDIYSILTYPANDTRFNVEGAFYIRFTKYVPEYYQKLVVKYGSTTIKTINGINDNAIFNFTSNELNTIYNLMSSVKEGKFTFTLYTYTDSSMGTLIGSDSKTPTGYITNANPTAASATYQDVNNTTLGLTGNSSIGIKGYSSIQINITQNAAGVKGATISYYVFPDNVSVNYSSSVSHTITNYNLTSLYVTAYDSRGNYTTTNIPYTYVNYRQPVINSLAVERKDGVEEETYLGINANLWNDNYATNRANEITYFGYRYKETSSSTWSNWIDRTGTFKTFVSGQQLDNLSISINNEFKLYTDVANQTGFPQGTQYNIQVRISDGYSTTVFNSDYEDTTLDDGTVLDSYNKTSTGYQYAINGLVDTTKTDGLQVYGDNHTTGKTKSINGFYSYDTGRVNTPEGKSSLIVKKCNNTEAPNNGVVLEYGNSTNWTGQLYIGDNATQGIYYNGWSNGVRGSWRRLADIPRTLYNNNTGIQSKSYASVSGLADYKKLAITFTVYKNSDQANTGGTAHICWLDLSKKDANGYARAGIVVPYSDSHLSSGNIQPNDFKALFEADINNNRVYCLFGYSGSVQTSSNYVMTKIEGYYN